jgi:hypothetical protein
MDGDADESLFSKISEYTLRITAIPLSRLRVPPNKIQMSPFLRMFAITFIFGNVSLFIFAMTQNTNNANFCGRIGTGLSILFFISIQFVIFSDLNPIPIETGENVFSERRRALGLRVIARDALYYVPLFVTVGGYIFNGSGSGINPYKNIDKSVKATVYFLRAMALFWIVVLVVCSLHIKFLMIARFDKAKLKGHLSRIAVVLITTIPPMVMLSSIPCKWC